VSAFQAQDDLIILSQRHGRRLLAEFSDFYNQDRVHLALAKDAPPADPAIPIAPPTLYCTIVLKVAQPVSICRVTQVWYVPSGTDVGTCTWTDWLSPIWQVSG
jgi:hypothetical protein